MIRLQNPTIVSVFLNCVQYQLLPGGGYGMGPLEADWVANEHVEHYYGVLWESPSVKEKSKKQAWTEGEVRLRAVSEAHGEFWI